MQNSAFKMTATPDQVKDWALFFDNLAAQIPCSTPDLTISEHAISEHAEKYRVLPAGERYPGPLNLDRSPFVREIMDNMSPMSPIRHTIVMKAAQVAITMIMECVMCYYIGYAPADQLLITATAELYRKWVGRRLEPAISSYGYREKIFAQEKRKSGKETGDKISSNTDTGKKSLPRKKENPARKPAIKFPARNISAVRRI
jgi:phage terminase large subunit GpA-like protein